MERLPRDDTLAITWISDVAGQVGHRVMSHGIGRHVLWAHGLPKCPIASYGSYLSIFVIFPAYK